MGVVRGAFRDQPGLTGRPLGTAGAARTSPHLRTGWGLCRARTPLPAPPPLVWCPEAWATSVPTSWGSAGRRGALCGDEAPFPQESGRLRTLDRASEPGEAGPREQGTGQGRRLHGPKVGAGSWRPRPRLCPWLEDQGQLGGGAPGPEAPHESKIQVPETPPLRGNLLLDLKGKGVWLAGRGLSQKGSHCLCRESGSRLQTPGCLHSHQRDTHLGPWGGADPAEKGGPLRGTLWIQAPRDLPTGEPLAPPPREALSFQ